MYHIVLYTIKQNQSIWYRNSSYAFDTYEEASNQIKMFVQKYTSNPVSWNIKNGVEFCEFLDFGFRIEIYCDEKRKWWEK